MIFVYKPEKGPIRREKTYFFTKPWLEKDMYKMEQPLEGKK